MKLDVFLSFNGQAEEAFLYLKQSRQAYPVFLQEDLLDPSSH